MIDPESGAVSVYFEIVTEQTEEGMPLSWAAHRLQDVVNAAVIDQ